MCDMPLGALLHPQLNSVPIGKDDFNVLLMGFTVARIRLLSNQITCHISLNLFGMNARNMTHIRFTPARAFAFYDTQHAETSLKYR